MTDTIPNERIVVETIRPADIDARVKAISPATAPPTINDWIMLATLNENLFDKEIKLSGDRIGWMMSTQSILFAAFCLILLNATTQNTETGKLLLRLIPVMSICVILAAGLGFIAAQIVIHRLERERSFYQAVLSRHFGIYIPDIGCRRDGWLSRTRTLGFAPSVGMMVILLFIWLIILLRRFNVTFTIGEF